MKSLAFGVVGAMGATVLWIVIAFVLPIALPMLVARLGQSGGVGMATAYITSTSILVAAAAGFVFGLLWSRRSAARH